MRPHSFILGMFAKNPKAMASVSPGNAPMLVTAPVAVLMVTRLLVV